MNSDLDILQNLIKDEAVVTVKKNQYDKNYLELEEPGGKGSSGYKIKVRNTPDDIIAIKSDIFPPPKKIFTNTKGECKRADFVIIAKGDRKNWIIYIEMKRGKHGKEKEIIQQLLGSRCFIDYCRTVGRTFWGEPEFLEENNYQQRYVSVKNISVNKKPSRITKSPLHDCPEKMLKISAPSSKGIWFKELSGRRIR